jgi:hypothetical protein
VESKRGREGRVTGCKRSYRVSPLLGRPYDSSTSSRTGLRRFHAPDAPRRLLGRMGSEDFITKRRVIGVDQVEAVSGPQNPLCSTHLSGGRCDPMLSM